MMKKKTILAIIGSASSNSANLKLVQQIAGMTGNELNLVINTDLKLLPHFDPELLTGNPPEPVVDFRTAVENADGIIICTPEYVFSIPSGLKNAIEWCISTTIFSGKPTGLITASANGQKAHEELQLVMKTAGARFTSETTLLIQGIKGKFDPEHNLTDPATIKSVHNFVVAFKELINSEQVQ